MVEHELLGVDEHPEEIFEGLSFSGFRGQLPFAFSSELPFFGEVGLGHGEFLGIRFAGNGAKVEFGEPVGIGALARFGQFGGETGVGVEFGLDQVGIDEMEALAKIKLLFLVD